MSSQTSASTTVPWGFSRAWRHASSPHPGSLILAAHTLTILMLLMSWLREALAGTVGAGGAPCPASPSFLPGRCGRGPVFLKASDLPAQGLLGLLTPQNL